MFLRFRSARTTSRSPTAHHSGPQTATKSHSALEASPHYKADRRAASCEHTCQQQAPEQSAQEPLPLGPPSGLREAAGYNRLACGSTRAQELPVEVRAEGGPGLGQVAPHGGL